MCRISESFKSFLGQEGLIAKTDDNIYGKIKDFSASCIPVADSPGLERAGVSTDSDTSSDSSIDRTDGTAQIQAMLDLLKI